MNAELKAIIELLSMLVLDPRTGVLIGLLVAAAWSDYGTGRIPNALVFGGAFLGLAYNTLVPPIPGAPLAAFVGSLAGLVCGLALMLPFYLLRAMGAGDVKLMAMSGAFLGFPETLWAVLATFLAGGALSLAYLLWKGALRRALLNIAALGITSGARHVFAIDAKTSAGTFPYGIAITVGTIGYLVLHQLGLVSL
jgi:prepilin peptidase CpaA